MRKTTLLLSIHLFLLASFAGIAGAQTPEGRLRKNPEFAKPKYAMKLLRSTFPKDRALIKNLRIFISPCHEVQAKTWQKDDLINIKICKELLDILDGKDEYVAVLGHEFGHIKLDHVPAYKAVILHTLKDFYPLFTATETEGQPTYIPGVPANIEFMFVLDYELLNIQEPEADAFSVEALRKNKRDVCAMQRVLKKLAESDGWYKENPDESDVLGRKRVAALEKECPSLQK